MTSQIGRDAVLSESYGRGYWYSAKCLLNLGPRPEMTGLIPEQLWSRDDSTQRLILHPGLALSVLRTRPQPLQAPPVRGISLSPPSGLGPSSVSPPQLPQSMNTPQTPTEPPRHHPPHPSTYTPRGNSPSPCTLRGPKTNQRTKVKPQ